MARAVEDSYEPERKHEGVENLHQSSGAVLFGVWRGSNWIVWFPGVDFVDDNDVIPQ